jgi:hypothetical protein
MMITTTSNNWQATNWQVALVVQIVPGFLPIIIIVLPSPRSKYFFDRNMMVTDLNSCSQ